MMYAVVVYVIVWLVSSFFIARYLHDDQSLGHEWGYYEDEMGPPALPALALGLLWPIGVVFLCLAIPITLLDRLAKQSLKWW